MGPDTAHADMIAQIKQHLATLTDWVNTIDEMREGDPDLEELDSLIDIEHSLQVVVEELAF